MKASSRAILTGFLLAGCAALPANSPLARLAGISVNQDSRLTNLDPLGQTMPAAQQDHGAGLGQTTPAAQQPPGSGLGQTTPLAPADGPGEGQTLPPLMVPALALTCATCSTPVPEASQEPEPASPSASPSAETVPPGTTPPVAVSPN